jgi:hypothetical protein
MMTKVNIEGTHNLQILRGLTNNRSLLSCTSNGSNVDLWSLDDSSGRQEWNVKLVEGRADVYNITVEGGVSGNKKYLSTTGNGDNVDLWDKDDGSGRQRWLFVPVKDSPTCNTFNVKVSAGVSGSRLFLSCTGSGDNVDLWSEDDGSGRQRWQVQGIWPQK